MAVFLIAAPGQNERLAQAIGTSMPVNDVYALAQGQWLVSIPNVTAKQVAERFGIGQDPSISAIVVSVGTYWGRHNRDLWEWIATKMAAANG